MKLIIIMPFLFFLNACSLFNSNQSGVYQKSNAIKYNFKNDMPSNWKAINGETSDLALSNTKTNSVFILNSSCRKFEGSSLNALTTSMLVGVEIVKVFDKKIIKYQDRDAMDMSVLGRVDGVERFFHIITTQKNNCIYDFVLISTTEKNLTNDDRDFQSFLKRIEIN